MARLLRETGGFILLENGFALLTEEDDSENAWGGTVSTFGPWDFAETPTADPWDLAGDPFGNFPLETPPSAPDWELTP